ncbi:MAG: CPBP family intramembrane glutamic endopeptidase [Bacteroidia bacterium]
MKQLGGYLKQYYVEVIEPSRLRWLMPVFFIVILTSLEYSLQIEKTLFPRGQVFWKGFLSHLTYYSLAWFTVWALMKPSVHSCVYWRNWVPFLLFGMAIYATRCAFNGHYNWLTQHASRWDTNTYYFYWFTAAQWVQALSIIVPLGLLGWLGQKRLAVFHGLRPSNMKPYLFLLMLASLIVIPAAMQDDFGAFYPRFMRMWPQGGDLQTERVLLFEISYALDFYATEYFFRGFLVLAFVRILGPTAILPMAVVYVMIHFGKPLGETISSFFGGMLLGIFSYYSRSIWGGILLHIGLAWMMELAGYFIHHR